MKSYHNSFTQSLNILKDQPGRKVTDRSLPMFQMMLETDVDVLNYALTLEHLEASFYELAPEYDLGSDGFGNDINEWIAVVGQHEADHVATLTQVITDLGGEPVERAEYDFGVTDAVSFLQVAMVLENVGVAAYDGAGQFIQNPELLTAAGSIVAVEARHAAYLNLLNMEVPFPDAFEPTMTPDEVLDAAGGFITN